MGEVAMFRKAVVLGIIICGLIYLAHEAPEGKISDAGIIFAVIVTIFLSAVFGRIHFLLGGIVAVMLISMLGHAIYGTALSASIGAFVGVVLGVMSCPLMEALTMKEEEPEPFREDLRREIERERRMAMSGNSKP